MTRVILCEMKTISKSKLKAEMLAQFRVLESEGGELIVTDHGKPTLKITPIRPKAPTATELFSSDRGGVTYHADILEPTADEWSQL